MEGGDVHGPAQFHKGELFGIAATHAPVDFRGMSWAVVKDGKVVEGFDTWNLGGVLDSLRTFSRGSDPR